MGRATRAFDECGRPNAERGMRIKGILHSTYDSDAVRVLLPSAFRLPHSALPFHRHSCATYAVNQLSDRSARAFPAISLHPSRMSQSRIFVWCLALALAGAPPAASQSPADGLTHAAPIARVTRVPAGVITIDGRLDEAAWATAEPVTSFTQFDPKEGEPATQRTEVRILIDEDAIYLGARMFESDPTKLPPRLERGAAVGVSPRLHALSGLAAAARGGRDVWRLRLRPRRERRVPAAPGQHLRHQGELLDRPVNG